MLVSNEKIEERLSNPDNLINRLRNGSDSNSSKRNQSMALFGIGRTRVLTASIPQAIHSTPFPEVIKKEEAQDVVTTFNPFPKTTATALIPSPSSNLPNTITPKETEAPKELTANDILDEADAKINLALAHDAALGLLNDSVKELKLRLGEIKADKLPSVISSASKVVESIRRERNEVNKNNGNKSVHYHFYTPEQKKVSDFDVIEVG